MSNSWPAPDPLAASNLQGFLDRHCPLLAEVLPEPRRILRQLIAFRLETSEASLLAWPDRPLTPDQVAQLNGDVAFLRDGGPLAHLFGTQPFLAWDFKCDRRALIPRPETEALVEQIIHSYRGTSGPARILDLCCGGGAMGLSLALAFPNARVYLTDLCPEALGLCQENRELHGLIARTTLYQGDLWDALDEGDFDLVVSNPPYVAAKDEVEHSVLNFEPHLALYSEDDGMAHAKRIIHQLPERLAPGGFAALELGHEHHQSLKPWLESRADADAFRFEADPYGVPRYLYYKP